jgi:asparagine synthase (glutamine-hydrolysing)
MAEALSAGIERLRSVGMCGLVGLWHRTEAAPPELLLTMAAELRHRGPDGVGLYLDGSFGMAGTRLAVVDLPGGDQPILNEDGRLAVMQNGEIYNHPELRIELEQLGHRFSTNCDTEVIVHAYEEWGVDCLARLNGDFAFAVWDSERRELFVARDRFGVRPLFLFERDGAVAFASEAKALLRHPRAARELDPVALLETFTTWAISPSRSTFTGIRELAPAHYLLLRSDGTLVERRWWDLDFAVTSDSPTTLRDAADELLALLDDATRIRLRADVPVAAYLSGGLDSSFIVALARDHVQRSLRAFGLGFTRREFDESDFQTELAVDLGASLAQVRVDDRMIGELLPQAVWYAERPTLRTALVPLLALSGIVREAGFKVVLTGEGADELFAGYDIFREDKIRRFWAREPSSRMRPALFAKLYPYLARAVPASRVSDRFFAHRLDETGHPLYSHLLRFSNTSRCARLLDPRFLVGAEADVVAEVEQRLPDSFAAFSPLGRSQYLEIATFLNHYLLHAQGDRMLMGHSVEGRFPFLDYRVAELAARLPDAYRLLGLTEKHVLRRAARDILPERIRARGKQPYRAPIASVFSGAAAPDYVSELTSPDVLERAGIFDAPAVAKLRAKADRHGELTETEEMALVGVVSTMLLHEQFVANPNGATTLQPDRVVTNGTAVPA